MYVLLQKFAGLKLLGSFIGLRPIYARLLLLGLAAIITLMLIFSFRGGLATFEQQVGALGWRLSPNADIEERINIVAIDEKSIAELGPWPWPRATMARLADALTQAGVQLQLYDIVFPEPKEGDDLLLAALQNSAAVLSQVPALQSDQLIQTGTMTHALGGVSCNNATSTQSYVANASVFAPIAKGHITPIVDSDGAVRSVPAFICVEGKAYPALAISALLKATNAQSWTASVVPGTTMFGPGSLLKLDAYPGLDIPLDAAGNLRVSFKNAPQTYRAFSAVDILNGEIDRSLLENTWALVGYTAFGLLDIVPTPFDGAAPGVEIQARILGSLLDNNVPYSPGATGFFLFVICAAFGGILLLFAAAREQHAGFGLPVCMIALPLLALTGHSYMLANANIWLGWLTPALYSLSAASLLLLHEYARVRMERGRVLSNLSAYLPTDVAQEIAYTLPNSSINAHRQDATLLSADLRNFSAFGEARPPEEAAALLHYFFVRTTAIIEKHHGRVHEFKGDSLLAIWDGSGSVPASQALQAALAMQAAIDEVLPQTPPAGLEPLALGIGIEQGPVLIGSIGPSHRRSHTLLGETVTITLRIQDMTAELAQPILLGECVARQLGDKGLQSQGSYLLSGLRIPHTLFAPPLQNAVSQKIKTEFPSLKVHRGGRQ